MKIYIGVPILGGVLPAAAAKLSGRIMISANAAAQRRPHFVGFRRRFEDLDELRKRGSITEMFLDSAGFVAWSRYGGFHWTPEEYVELVKALRPTTWASMDACCEPELAANGGAVRERQRITTDLLGKCREAASAAGVAPPLPVIQGWRPDDYCRHASELDLEPGSRVGVGSVCRRPMRGPDGLLAIVRALDGALDPGIRLHLFGVKSNALQSLARNPRVVSVDSMAWDFRARRIGAKSVADRSRVMGTWYSRQVERLQSANRNLSLPFGEWEGAPR